MKPRLLLTSLGVILLLASACGGASPGPSPKVIAPVGTPLSADEYSFAISDDPPAEREPGFDLVGPVWDVRGPALPGDQPLTIELPAPDSLPPGVDPLQLKIASFRSAVGDGIAGWVIASDVEHDEPRRVLSTRAGDVGLFAAAAPNDYWTTAMSRDGNYLVHYVSDPEIERAADREYVDRLLVELEDARRWLVDNGYPEPRDTFGGAQPVYLVPLIGGPGLTEPSNLGSVIKLDTQLHRSPDAIAGAVTHELFHLSQQRAMFDLQRGGTWIREATAEYVAVQRLGVSGARPHIDTSCSNYMRSLVDTRGINEYHNWTFVAYLEHVEPGFVRRFFESAGGSGDGVDVLREIAPAPLSEIMARYAGSYRLLQDYLPGGEVSCPAPESVDVQSLDGRELRLPALAGMAMVADLSTRREIVLTIEADGDPDVILWGFTAGSHEPIRPSGTGPLGRLEYDLDCAVSRSDGAIARPDRIAVLIGAGEQPARIDVSVGAGNEC